MPVPVRVGAVGERIDGRSGVLGQVRAYRCARVGYHSATASATLLYSTSFSIPLTLDVERQIFQHGPTHQPRKDEPSIFRRNATHRNGRTSCSNPFPSIHFYLPPSPPELSLIVSHIRPKQHDEPSTTDTFTTITFAIVIAGPGSRSYSKRQILSHRPAGGVRKESFFLPPTRKDIA
jgi:hypothetical protein